MGKSSGGVLILAGIAVGAYALWPQHWAGTEIATVQDAGRVRATASMDARRRPATGVEQPARPAAPSGTVPAKRSAAPVSPAAEPAPLAPPPPVAASPPRPRVPAVRIDNTPPRVPVGEVESAAAPPLDDTALTREIQRHLKRVGCYQGAVTGVWSPAVRRAMQAFTARVNASLPIEQPDPVLLAIVRSQAPGACGAACPPGQSHATDGRCLPTALIANAEAYARSRAKANAKANAGRLRASSGQRTHSASAASRDPQAPAAAYRPMEGRMSLAGPRAGAAGVTRPRQARALARSRAAQARARHRRAAQRRPSSGFTGFPGWFFPF